MMKRMDHGRSSIAAAVLMLAVTGAWTGGDLFAQGEPLRQESFRPPPGALIAPGRAADLTLLYTGDVIGYLDPCG